VQKNVKEKLLETACPHHPYPVKHKLKDYTMMKKFMASGAPPICDRPGRNLGGKCAAPVPREVEVMTIFD
jgi:hypothetical protein